MEKEIAKNKTVEEKMALADEISPVDIFVRG